MQIPSHTVSHALVNAIAPALDIDPREEEEHYHLYIVSRQISADDFDQVNELDDRYRTLGGMGVAMQKQILCAVFVEKMRYNG